MDDIKQQENNNNEETTISNNNNNNNNSNGNRTTKTTAARQRREIRKRPTLDIEEILLLSSDENYNNNNNNNNQNPNKNKVEDCSKSAINNNNNNNNNNKNLILSGKRFSNTSPLSSIGFNTSSILIISKQPTIITTSSINLTTTTTTTTTTAATATRTTSSGKIHSKMPPVKDKKEKKRERWLLTRKTWKYMTDAGRKLIPDGSQNRNEDIPKIEKNFQNICSSEPKFILWKRKASYPGAMGATRHSKRRLKQLLSRSHKSISSADEAEELLSPEIKEANKNADQIITILQNYLCLNDNKKTAPLLGTKTVRPDQTQSPSAQRPTFNFQLYNPQQQQQQQQQQQNKTKNLSNSLNLAEQIQRANDTQAQIQELLEKLHQYSKNCSRGSQILLNIDKITPDILENKILLKQIYNDLKKQQLHRILGRHSSTTSTKPPIYLPHASSFSNILNFKRNNTGICLQDNSITISGNLRITDDINKTKINQSNLKNIDLRPIGIQSSYSNTSSNIPNVQLRNIGSTSDNSTECSNKTDGDRQKTGTLSKIHIKKSPQITYSTLGTQTDFIHLHELQRLAKDYDTKKKEEERAAALSPTDDESDKGGGTQARSRRKSSIDNEDVSQSVSDTIKRYLRMARKKSVHDNNANRFKRVNYDRNLRNIKAKGEINPPGMDEGNSKQIQTLDAWPVIALEYIRGIENSKLLSDAHIDWQQALDKRIQQKEEYDKKINEKQKQQQQQQNDNETDNRCINTTIGGNSGENGSHSHLSSGILYTGQQFLSNLWHGHGSSGGSGNNPSVGGGTSEQSYQPSPSSSIISISSAPAVGSVSTGIDSSFQKYHSKDQITMQKSKSSSNVGQFVSTKIWKSRSKSQTRTTSLNNIAKPIWTPQGNGVWISSTGKYLTLADTKLDDLFEIERKVLHKVAVEKINQLNIGINVTVPPDNTTDPPAKSQKRRPLLMKRKAITTSFFDSGKNKQSSKNSTSSGGVFGVSLEKCVENDQKLGRDSENVLSEIGTSGSGGNISHKSDRGSRNSIASLLGTSVTHKNEKEAGSCESLPANTTTTITCSTNLFKKSDYDNPNSTIITGSVVPTQTIGSNLIKTAASKISRSQSDVRRTSQGDDDLDNNLPSTRQNPPGLSRNSIHKIPALVIACIKHLEEHGLHTVGIFRVSTSKKRVRQLKEEFDQGEINVLDPETCPHDVATILKEYFRDLPEPLLCRNLYKAFVKTQKIRNRRLQLEALSHLVQLLPVAHRDTLYCLLKFLAKVVRSSDDVTSIDGTVLSQGNKMDSSNLATVFAPNILRPSSSTTTTTEQDLDEQIDVINVIRTMIDHYEELFRVSSELMDEIYTYMLDVFPQQLDYLCDRRDFHYNDELDSASSSTPVSSPPPIMALSTDQHGQVFREFIPSNAPISSVLSSSIPRRVYSREDVMHERAATSNDPNNVGVELENGLKRRERASRMKYVENENEIQRRRRLRSSNSSNSNSNTISLRNSSDMDEISSQISIIDTNARGQISPMRKSKNNNNSSATIQYSTNVRQRTENQQQHGITHRKQLQDSKNRKFSSPFILQSTGVVTASLKIPIQMQQQQQQNDFQDTGNSSLYSPTSDPESDKYTSYIDFSDIPYIEDVSNYSHDNNLWQTDQLVQETPITGSLSFSNNNKTQNITRKGSCDSLLNTYQIPVSLASGSNTINSPPSNTIGTGYSDLLGTTTTTSSSSGTAISYGLVKSKTTPTAIYDEGSISRKQSSGIGSDLSDSELYKLQGNSRQNLEPKITPSITNIGGAVLRSKTADFERILSHNKKLNENNLTSNNNNSRNEPDTLSTTTYETSNQSTIRFQSTSNQQRLNQNTKTKEELSSTQQQQQQQLQAPNRRSSSQGPIYKRQELISSAKRSSQNKHQ